MPVIRAFWISGRNLIFAVTLMALACGFWLYPSGARERKSIEALSAVMAGRLIVIDPGHGGIDSGSRGFGGSLEEDITLAVSKKLAELVAHAGALVILTRESDVWLADPDAPHKKRSDLTRRVEIANQKGADLFISIHVNSFVRDRGQRGAQTFSQPGSDEGKILSRLIQNELSRVLKNTSRKPEQIDYFIRHCKMPAVIVEIGFISNPAEEKLLMDPAYQSKTAFAIYCGLVKYLADRDMRKQNQDPKT